MTIENKNTKLRRSARINLKIHDLLDMAGIAKMAGVPEKCHVKFYTAEGYHDRTREGEVLQIDVYSEYDYP